MVGKKRRRGQKSLAGSHQRCWLWGRHAVLEMLRAGRWRPLELLVAPAVLGEVHHAEVRQLAAAAELRLVDEEPDRLTALCRSRDHQGLVARLPPFPYADKQTTLGRLTDGSFVLMLSGIQDPFNFGSILRSADLFGADAVIVAARGQAEVTSHVARSSAGAVNYLEIVRVDSLLAAAEQLRTCGLRLIAATERGDDSAWQANLNRGLALVIGNEGAGIPPDLLAMVDEQVRVPIGGHVGSLNAAVAAGILCYEIRRQRQSRE